MAGFPIWFRFRSDTSGLTKADRAVQRTQRGLGQLAGAARIAGGALGALGTAKLLQFLRGSTAAAKVQAQAFAQLEAAVRSTGGAAGFTAKEMAQQAAALQRVTLFGDEVTMSMQAVLATFTKISGETFPRTTALVQDMSVRMGQDLKSAALQLGKALNDPIRGLDGLNRSGVQFTDAQKEVIKALAEGGRLAEAQAKILDELETQFGGSAEAAAKAAGGGLQQMNDVLSDMQEQIGFKVLPVLDRLGRAFVDLTGPTDGLAQRFIELNRIFKDQPRRILENIKVFRAFAEVLNLLDIAAGDVKETLKAVHHIFDLDLVEGTVDFSNATADTAARQKELQQRFDELAKSIEAAKKRIEAKTKANREMTESYRESKQAIAEAQAQIEKSLQNSGGGFFGIDLTHLSDAISGSFAGAVPGLDADFRKVAKSFAVEVGLSIADVMNGGSIRSAFANLANFFAGAINNAIGQNSKQGGFGSALASAGVWGALIGAGLNLAFSQVQGTPGAGPREFLGAVQIFQRASRELGEAARSLQELANSVRRSLGDLQKMVGSVLFTGITYQGPGSNQGGGAAGNRPGSAGRGGDKLPDKFGGSLRLPFGPVLADIELAVQQIGESFHVSIGNLAAGVGSSLEEAVKNALDRFAQSLPLLIEQGKVTLAGIPKILADVLRAGAASFDELKQNLELALGLFTASIGEARTILFESFSDLSHVLREATRLGLDPETVARGITVQLQQAFSQIAGADLFPQMVNVAAAMRQVRQGLRDLGIAGQEARDRLAEAELSLRLYNRQLRVDVLGQLASMAQQFGVQAEFVQRIERARVRIQFAIIKAQLTSLGLFERFRDIWRELRGLALAAANDLGAAAQSLGRISGSTTSIASSINTAAKSVDSVLSDIDPGGGGKSSNVGPFKQAMQAIEGLISGIGPQVDPITKLRLEYDRIASIISKIKDGEKLEKATAALEKFFGKALDAAIQSIMGPLQEFRDSLDVSQFGGGTRGEKAALAMSRFQELLQKALAGDISALQALQGAGQTALSLGSAAFGTSSAAFRELFEKITGGLDQALKVDLKTGMDSQTTALVDAQHEVLAVISSGNETRDSLLSEIRDRLEELNRPIVAMQV